MKLISMALARSSPKVSSGMVTNLKQGQEEEEPWRQSNEVLWKQRWRQKTVGKMAEKKLHPPSRSGFQLLSKKQWIKSVWSIHLLPLTQTCNNGLIVWSSWIPWWQMLHPLHVGMYKSRARASSGCPSLARGECSWAPARDGYWISSSARLGKSKFLSKLELELGFLTTRVPYQALGSPGSCGQISM
jgi:hypothetical protein